MQRRFVFLVCSLIILNRGAFGQGSLTPPGAPAPTMRTLAQIEPRTPISSLPFTITAPGSYYVTSNLVGVAGSGGITIRTNNVTIDLNGFTLFGPSSGTFDDGITPNGSWSNIVIRNGKLSGWTRSGIGAGTLAHCIVEDVISSENRLSGIVVGDSSIVQRCSARRNGLSTTSQSGIWVGDGAMVSDCTVSGHDGPDSIGIRADSRGVIRNCTVIENNSTNGSGISINSYGVIVNCVVTSNRGGTNNLGIYAGVNSQVKNCIVSINSGDGIVSFDNSYIVENECTGNSGGGINLTGNNARADGNHVADNALFGIKASVTNGGNLIIRNSSFNNPPNYSIASGNKDAAVLTPGSAFSSTAPWANF
jgi:hypothetical protein